MHVRLAKSVMFALALAAASGAHAAGFEIEWGRPVELGPGGYARMHRLSDGRYMAAYERSGAIFARFAPSLRELRAMTAPVAVARSFRAPGGAAAGTDRVASVGTGRVALANAEFAQLETGRIVYACNLRSGKSAAHPYGIAIATSDDGGATWSALKTVYLALTPGYPEAAAHGCGCWEPFVHPLEGGKAQIYFSDESPYFRGEEAQGQNISVIETADNGETWSAPRVVAYTPERRDGMPVVLDLGDWRYLAIEANPGDTLLHPQIVMCPVRGDWKDAVRFEPLAAPPDWRGVYGGAPYIAATENYVLLSWQETALPGDPLATAVARVAAMPKCEIGADGRIAALRAVSTPPGMAAGKDRMVWNSLCPAGGDTFLLVSEVKGKVIAYPGRIVKK